MSTVDEQRDENNETTKELDELDRFLREQGIQLKNECIGEGIGRNYEENRGGLSSSIYEQKRHYEQEIEVLKKDLEAIE